MDISLFKEKMPSIWDIARESGRTIMHIYNNSSVDIDYKTDDSPVTNADKAANKIICEGLMSLTPTIPIISEEYLILPYQQRKNLDYMWMVDPLDGTREFINRNGDFTVNIALIHEGRSIAGVVYAPAYDQLYSAIHGDGAYQIEGEDHIPIKCSTYHSTDAGLRIVCSRSHINPATVQYIEDYNAPTIIRVGSSLKLMYLATGRADIYPRLGPTSEWDIAAAQIILEESGGSVIDTVTNVPLAYNKENILNNHFVAKGIEYA